jgi:hypothetical protein
MTSRECAKNQKGWARRVADDAIPQEAVCKFIIQELGPSQIGLPDKHGDTASHHLAGAKFPNMPLIDWLKG